MKEGVGRALRRVIGRDDVLSRIRPRESGISVLMNEKRRAIYQYVHENPLTHLRRLSRETGLPIGTVDWHLRILTESGIISVFREKNRRRFYPSEWIEEDDLLCLAKLQNDVSRAILLLVREKPNLSQTAIANNLGKYQQYVQPHLAELEECGFLTSREEGARKVYTVSGKIEEIENKYIARSQDYLEKVLEMLRRDGLNPKIQSRSKVSMRVRGDDGRRFFYLKIRANPVKTILGK